MDIMFLVVGLAVAGLVGIAAAFYFSIRSGNRRDKRLRSARAGRAVTDRHPGSRSGTARPDLAGHPRRAASGGGPTTTFTPAAVSSRNYRAKADTGPDPVADFDQVLAGSRRAARGAAATRPRRQAPPQDPWPGEAEAADSWPDDSWPGDSRPDDPTPGDPATADPMLGPGDVAARTAKPRRRKGFRKGADLDEELWPTETFGGVSDEQFWDDLASDKPLATTARTAQQDSPGKSRPPVSAPVTGLGTGPVTDPQAVQAQADDRKRDDRARGRGRRDSGSGAYTAAPRTGPDPAAERTAIQPAYAATQPVQSMKSQPPGATQPVRVAASTGQPMTASQPMATGQPMSVASRPGTGGQPREAATQPTETRRRRPSSAEEDPLTSSAFSLRPSGPVDGRSSLRARNSTADQSDTSSPYPYSAPSYGDSSSVTQTTATPPHGQDYGYGRGDSAAQAGEPRRHNGTRSHARPDGTGEGTRTARQAYPRHSSQTAGSHEGNGGYPGNGNQTGSYPVGGYPGNGHRGNGHRAPYDPRDDYRRLTPQH
jgi:hypothetical protein